MRQIIRDNKDRPIGHIKTSGSNSQLYDKTGGKLLATYNKGTDRTHTANGKLVGKGNLLQTQIKK